MAQKNFESVRVLFFHSFVDTNRARTCIMLEGTKEDNLKMRPAYHKKYDQFRTDFNKWLDKVDIREAGSLIDELIKHNIKIPSWMKNKKYVIDYNEDGQLDLIKTD